MEEKKLVNIVFGNYIRTKRIENGFTLEGLAGKFDMDGKHLSWLELGQKMPGFMTVYKIAKVLEFNDPFFLMLVEEVKRLERKDSDS